MAILTRRDFIASAAAMAAGTSVRAAAPGGPSPAASVRAPAPGQTWRYSKLDYFTAAQVDQQVDHVAEVGSTVKIISESGKGHDAPVAFPKEAGEWIHRFLPNSDTAGASNEEIQAPWGMVLVDPHWDQLQVYETPISLWPAQMQPGWGSTVNTNYMTPDRAEAIPWQLTMNAHRWEYVTVPAGRFRALRYHNLINFRFSSISERVSAQREEDIWFAPEIGRWVARNSWGTFYQDVGERLHESSYRWELFSWT